MDVVTNRALKHFLFLLGVLSLILGVIGAFLPVLPTTPFILLSAWCFLRSSPKAHRWLYRQPLLGKALRDWETTRSISFKAKIAAITMIIVSGITVAVKVRILWLKVAVELVLVCVSVFIATRKTKA